MASTWKRLESSSVSDEIDEGLAARIADPLWLLARQWQVGELQGDDAASPILMKVEARHHPVGRYRPGPDPSDGSHEVDLTTSPSPLECLVEREDVRNGPAQPRIAAEAGLDYLRAMEAAGVPPSYRADFRAAFPLTLGDDDGVDPRGRRRLSLLARRAPDGAALYAALLGGADAAALSTELTFDSTLAPAVRAAAAPWVIRYAGIFQEPSASVPNPWDSSRMEYAFSVAAPDYSGARLKADEYAGGRLDWYSFDLDQDASTGGTLTSVSVLPSPVRYRGMPAPRWWEVEDRTIHFGDIGGGQEDLARAVVATFATTYSDDWFMVPIRLDVGVLARVTQFEVKDNFGEINFPLSAAANDHVSAGDARTWRFFELKGDPRPSMGECPWLLLPDVLPDGPQGEALEEVLFARDEVANLAWAIERRVESEAGLPVDRRALSARRGRSRVREMSETWGYTLSPEVPEHWVPLVPVRVSGTQAIRLQRGRLPVTGGAGTGETRGAIGHILVPDERLLIHEEEVPRGGARVSRAFQMSRDVEGQIFLWVGRRKRLGRGEVRSSLIYDTLSPEG